MSSNVKKVKSPETGRWIKVGGPAYQKLSSAGVSFSGQNTMVRPAKQYPLHKNSVSNAQLRSVAAMTAVHTGPTRGRGSRTKGWGAVAPHLVSNRQALKKACGNSCFLVPERMAFPICRRCESEPCQCEVDCHGLTAAKVRANQWKYKNVANAANRLIKEKCMTNQRGG